MSAISYVSQLGFRGDHLVRIFALRKQKGTLQATAGRAVLAARDERKNSHSAAKIARACVNPLPKCLSLPYFRAKCMHGSTKTILPQTPSSPKHPPQNTFRILSF